MATYNFRILLESVEGKKLSFISQSFVDTSVNLVLSSSQVYNRITGSVSCSYQNVSEFSGSDFNKNFTFKDNNLLSASLSGSNQLDGSESAAILKKAKIASFLSIEIMGVVNAPRNTSVLKISVPTFNTSNANKVNTWTTIDKNIRKMVEVKSVPLRQVFNNKTPCLDHADRSPI